VASDLTGIEQRLDDLAIPFLVPMRVTKEVDRELLTKLLDLGDEQCALSGDWSDRPICPTMRRRMEIRRCTGWPSRGRNAAAIGIPAC
jgi:hypothetical protein